MDAVLAAAGGGGAMALLHGVDYTGLLPTRLFAPPMLGSAIVLFGGSAPPPPGDRPPHPHPPALLLAFTLTPFGYAYNGYTGYRHADAELDGCFPNRHGPAPLGRLELPRDLPLPRLRTAAVMVQAQPRLPP